MGLPAFDMSAFETAQAAVRPAPRVSTGILLGSGVSRHAKEDGHRQRIRKDIDLFVSSIESWRSGAFAGTAQMRAVLEFGVSRVPLPYLAKLCGDFKSHMEEIETVAREDAVSDQKLIALLRAGAEDAAQISAPAGRFLRKELKRLEQTAELRQETYTRINVSLGRMMKQALDTIDKNTIRPPTFGSDDEKVAFLDALSTRPVDLSGVAERTKKRLLQFPKTANYLAR